MENAETSQDVELVYYSVLLLVWLNTIITIALCHHFTILWFGLYVQVQLHLLMDMWLVAMID